MSRFEYLSVLISIVIALGIGEVTVCWGRLLQHRDQVRFSWIHLFWSAFILVLMIQFWWGFWNFRTVEGWSFASLIGVVLEAITLVVCSLLLTPGRSLSGEVDLGRLYYDNARPFFLLGGLLLLQLGLIDTLVLGMPLIHMENLIRLVALGVVALAAWSSDTRLHTMLPIAAALLLGIFLVNSIML